MRHLTLLLLVTGSCWLSVEGCGATDSNKGVMSDDAGAGGVEPAPGGTGGGAQAGHSTAGSGQHAGGTLAEAGASSTTVAAGGDAGAGLAGAAGATPTSAAGAAGAAGEGPVDPRCLDISPSATVTAHLQITADNECEVFVNGASAGTTTNWGSPVTLDVGLFVHPGLQNIVAVHATNTSSQDGNDRGIIGVLRVGTTGSETDLLVTDGAWRSSKTEVAGWTQLDFDDAAWPFATVIADNGDAPWGTQLAAPSAKWLWSDVVPNSTADKPNVEDAYVRRAFYFDLDGVGLSTAPSCPAP